MHDGTSHTHPLRRNPQFVFRNVGTECVLVKVSRRASEHEFLYALNEVGSFVWERLDGETSNRELCDAIVAEFEVGADEAEADLTEFLEELRRIDAVRAD